ncbi:galactose oxidase-like domain-containing protein, partial [Nitrosomonas aestuarii]
TEAPAHGNIAPPGFYMLFVVNNQDVPSEARFVLIS